jgi:alanyl-tRNA synthetase
MRLLGVEDPVFPELLPASRDAMAPSYPEVATGFERISSLAYAEEEAFRTPARGHDPARHGGSRDKESGRYVDQWRPCVPVA